MSWLWPANLLKACDHSRHKELNWQDSALNDDSHPLQRAGASLRRSIDVGLTSALKQCIAKWRNSPGNLSDHSEREEVSGSAIGTRAVTVLQEAIGGSVSGFERLLKIRKECEAVLECSQASPDQNSLAFLTFTIADVPIDLYQDAFRSAVADLAENFDKAYSGMPDLSKGVNACGDRLIPDQDLLKKLGELKWVAENRGPAVFSGVSDLGTARGRMLEVIASSFDGDAVDFFSFNPRLSDS